MIKRRGRKRNIGEKNKNAIERGKKREGRLTCTTSVPDKHISKMNKKIGKDKKKTHKIAGITRRGGIGRRGLASLHAGLDGSRPIEKKINKSRYKRGTMKKE